MTTTVQSGEPPDIPARVRVLIADDDLGQRALLRHWIERHGSFDVAEEAVDGVEAVDAATRLHPQVAGLDLAMPRMDGLEAAA
jgi:chemotaxis response regulator CheB